MTQPIISDANYFDHHIYFDEASVDAQGRLVDNIAVTYRLKNVNLDTAANIDKTEKARPDYRVPDSTVNENFGFASYDGYRGMTGGKKFEWVFPDWYEVDLGDGLVKPSDVKWDNFLKYQEIPVGEEKEIRLPVPMLRIYYGTRNAKTYTMQGYCSLNVKVVQKSSTTKEEETIVNMFVDPVDSDPVEGYWDEGWESPVLAVHSFSKGISYSRTNILGQLTEPYLKSWVKRVTQYDTTRKNRVIQFTAKYGYSYSVYVNMANLLPTEEMYQFTEPANPRICSFYYGMTRTISLGIYWNAKNTSTYTQNSTPQAAMSFFTSSPVTTWLESANIATAYELFNKAQLSTQLVRKIPETSIDETPQSYYLEENDALALRNTQIVENFYNQKNWWEVLIDIGKYIHAIPKVRFGRDNRFVVEWRRLGITEQSTGVNNDVSVFNSRSIEDYIAACSSYVTNMVQLGGIIEEWVAPKSSSEDYLVYNDVAEIQTSKNIIEIISVEIREPTHGITKDITPYVYEKNIYQLLDVVPTTVPNKGLAIFYNLGENKIQGFNFRLPTKNPGEGEYAIKRIIGTVYGFEPTVWESIVVNDYVFHIVYRTQETVRSDQTRPDLRKYLLQTKYDRTPQHRQFNNQQDTVADSVKFGDNTYGRLIRTGNTTYTIREWTDGLFNVKRAGQLYEIRGELYYVTKVKSVFYFDHVICDVEFSKDYNKLSQIIGIPSEPRFYEISEQSQIRRSKVVPDYLVLGTSDGDNKNTDSFIQESGWDYIQRLMFPLSSQSPATYPRYAATIFKNDIDKDDNVAGNETFMTSVLHPVGTYSIRNTLTISWRMKDNFSAGDQVVQTSLYLPDKDNEPDGAFARLVPYQYPDVHGRADMFDFLIFPALELSDKEIRELPALPKIDIAALFGSENTTAAAMNNTNGLVLLKDNREALSFDYNLELLTDSDRFVVSGWVWSDKTDESGENNANIAIALLNEEINKISNETIDANFISQYVYSDFSVDTSDEKIVITIPAAMRAPIETGMYKAIAIISTNEVNGTANSSERYFVFGRNITGLSADEAMKSWTIKKLDKDTFPRQ